MGLVRVRITEKQPFVRWAEKGTNGRKSVFRYSVHKVEMYDREHQARKTSLADNIRDIFIHQTASSDPVVRSFDKKPMCSRCSSTEHYTVSCPSKGGVARNSTHSDIFNSLIVMSDEEEPEDQRKYLKRLKATWNV